MRARPIVYGLLTATHPAPGNRGAGVRSVMGYLDNTRNYPERNPD